MYTIIVATLALFPFTNSEILGFTPQQVENPHLYPYLALTAEKAKQLEEELNVTTLPPLWVYDPLGYLRVQTLKLLHKKLQLFHDETTAELAVALIDKISSNQSISSFSIQVFDIWRLGNKETNNGLLLLLSIDDREMNIQLGKGVKQISSDKLQAIMQKMIPHLHKEDYDKAVDIGITELISKFNGSNLFDISVPIIVFSVLPFVLIILCVCVYESCSKKIRLKKYLKEIDGLQQHLQNKQSAHSPYFSTVCPIFDLSNDIIPRPLTLIDLAYMRDRRNFYFQHNRHYYGEYSHDQMRSELRSSSSSSSSSSFSDFGGGSSMGGTGGSSSW
ncbi:MAG: hypothetical protein EZS28_025307 [Streblomastix strix]|uniref:TPM domain-containing protein n=1 Tax=Streblomastix strix TaxID=222440 RepID=A0A5J4V9J6_9EUKA|nr:MAG: hypothetical protein EZS28_025307 [Streblomastix strix]